MSEERDERWLAVWAHSRPTYDLDENPQFWEFYVSVVADGMVYWARQSATIQDAQVIRRNPEIFKDIMEYLIRNIEERMKEQ